MVRNAILCLVHSRKMLVGLDPSSYLLHCLKSVRRRNCSCCRSMSTYHGQTIPVSRNFIIGRCIVVLFGTSLSGYALLNASRTAANDFDTKYCSRTNTRSHLHNFRATGVSSGLATRVTLTRVSRDWLGESITRGWTCF
jgi:hypothetical protein